MSVSSCYGFTDSRLETGIVGQDFCRAFAMVVDGDRPAPGMLPRLMIAFQHTENNQPVEAHQRVELASSQGLDLLGDVPPVELVEPAGAQDRKSTRLNSSHTVISYAVFCLKKKKK